jgi:hypothetical protein
MTIFDTWIVYKFIRLLTTPFDETDAFKLGVINGSGELLKKTDDLTSDQQASYTLFHRLVFNLKRLIEKIPGGKSKIGTYAAALFLLREEMGDEEGVLVMERSFMSYLKENNAVEGNHLEEQYLPEETLAQGNYRTLNIMLDQKGDTLPKGTIVVAKHDTKPSGRVLGVDVYELQVAKTGKAVIISNEDVSEV